MAKIYREVVVSVSGSGNKDAKAVMTVIQARLRTHPNCEFDCSGISYTAEDDMALMSVNMKESLNTCQEKE